jgi:hypothetical protein
VEPLPPFDNIEPFDGRHLVAIETFVDTACGGSCFRKPTANASQNSIGRRKVLNNDLPRAVNEQLSSTPRAE